MVAKKVARFVGKLLKSVIFAENSFFMESGKIEIKFGILDRVVYLNTATARFETAVVKGIRVVPTGIHKDESGVDVLDGYVVLYELFDGPMLAQDEVFGTAEEAKAYWIEQFSRI